MRTMATHFFWLLDTSLAGMERPGAFCRVEEDLRLIRERGISILISLTLSPPGFPAGAVGDLELFHIPVEDGSAPTLDQIRRFIGYVNYGLHHGKKVLAHCDAGYGRTGTMLACYLVSLGSSAREAIDTVRRKQPGAIETSEQEARIFEYERSLRGKGDCNNPRRNTR